MKIKDPFEQWRGREDVLILTVPVSEDLAEEVAARLENRRFPSFTIWRAIAGLGCIELCYETSDRLTLENFTGGRGVGTWPPDLTMQVMTTVSAVRTQRNEDAERRRIELDREDFERNYAENVRRGVLFPDRAHNMNLKR